MANAKITAERIRSINLAKGAKTALKSPDLFAMVMRGSSADAILKEHENKGSKVSKSEIVDAIEMLEMAKQDVSALQEIADVYPGRGAAPKKVGDTSTAKVNNYNAKNNKAVTPTVSVSLTPYDWSKEKDAKVKISYEKDKVVITKS